MEQEQVAEKTEETVEVEVADPSIKEQKEQEVPQRGAGQRRSCPYVPKTS